MGLAIVGRFTRYIQGLFQDLATHKTTHGAQRLVDCRAGRGNPNWPGPGPLLHKFPSLHKLFCGPGPSLYKRKLFSGPGPEQLLHKIFLGFLSKNSFSKFRSPPACTLYCVPNSAVHGRFRLPIHAGRFGERSFLSTTFGNGCFSNTLPLFGSS